MADGSCEAPTEEKGSMLAPPPVSFNTGGTPPSRGVLTATNHQQLPAYTKSLDLGQRDKSHWRPAEDALLSELVKTHGPKTWNSLAKHLPGRHGKQLRERWLNHLDPAVNHSKWTEKENMILLQKQAELGNHWSRIRPFLPGRPDNSIKNQWHWVLRRRVDAANTAGTRADLLHRQASSDAAEMSPLAAAQAAAPPSLMCQPPVQSCPISSCRFADIAVTLSAQPFIGQAHEPLLSGLPHYPITVAPPPQFCPPAKQQQQQQQQRIRPCQQADPADCPLDRASRHAREQQAVRKATQSGKQHRVADDAPPCFVPPEAKRPRSMCRQARLFGQQQHMQGAQGSSELAAHRSEVLPPRVSCPAPDMNHTHITSTPAISLGEGMATTGDEALSHLAVLADVASEAVKM